MPPRSPASALSDACALAACAIGGGVLLAGSGRIAAIQEGLGDAPHMHPATAAAVLALGVLVLVVRRINTDRFHGTTGIVGSVALAAVVLFAIRRFTLPGHDNGGGPPTVSPHTVSSLVLVLTGLLVSIRADERRRQLAILFALGAAVVPWLAMLGYTNGVPLFYALPDAPMTGIAATAAVALLLLSVGIMGLFPDHGFVALFAGHSQGGTLMRVVLPAALLFPLLVGGVSTYGSRAGWFGRDAGLALNLGVTSAVVTGLVMWIALIFKRREAERLEAEAERAELLASLRTSLDALSKLQNNLVTVCAWTQRVLDQGKWVRFEEFLDTRLNISITHGISDEAAQDELQSLEDWMSQSSLATQGAASSSSALQPSSSNTDDDAPGV